MCNEKRKRKGPEGTAPNDAGETDRDKEKNEEETRDSSRDMVRGQIRLGQLLRKLVHAVDVLLLEVPEHF